MRGARISLSFALWLFSPALHAADDFDAPALAPTDATRTPETLIKTPNAISVVPREEFYPTRPLLGVDEGLDVVPGVFPQSSGNFAQDPRISIRGYGARATFGIRDIQVRVDDFPTTLPDGQSEVDSIDLAFVERIDVLRGPSSSLFGGAGGGAISFTTLSPTDEPLISVRSLFGSHHL